MMSSAHCVTVLLCLAISFIHARKDGALCPGKHSVWDKWYDGCNWCVCTEDGPQCTDNSCYRLPVDQCQPLGEKWRDGCYRCQCSESGIVCTADHRCVHAMRNKPYPCDQRVGCVCGLDGLSSCIADTMQADAVSYGYEKRLQDNKYVSNVPHWSKDRFLARTRKMTCRDAKRWYSGTKRCFCADGVREPTCGDPRYIAHRVDGFRFKIAQCYSNQQWKYNCRRCMCHMYGFGFCVRIPHCKRNSTDRHVSLNNECVQGRQWRDGCKYCKCTSDNKIVCDNTGCNFSGNMAETEVKVKMPTIVLGETQVKIIGGGEGTRKEDKYAATLPGAVDVTVLKDNLPPFQLPPPHNFNMARSFRNKGKPGCIKQILCEGKYKPGEKFYDKCNLCECTHTGSSKCTAILCV